jgi:hypothetical protein
MNCSSTFEVPRPQADKTGRLRRTGPLTLPMIAQERELKSLRQENAAILGQLSVLQSR